MTASQAPPASDEPTRLAALQALQVLDTLPEQEYDDVVLLAAQICRTPISLVSLIDVDRQWFKAQIGLGMDQTHRDLAFCAHAIAAPERTLIVEDTLQDSRFKDNSLVTGAPCIRFYAGAPIVMPDGQAMGTVCVIDTVPRSLDAAQVGALQAMARQTSVLFQLRRAAFAASDSQRRLRTIADNLPAVITQIDQEQRYRFVNAEAGRVFGVDSQTMLGRTMQEVGGAADYALVAPHVAAALRGEPASFSHSAVVADRTVYYRSSYIPDVDPSGRVNGFYAMTFDITELQETQRELELLARVDSLTGLPNRRQFDERLHEAMIRTRRTMRPMAVMFLNIDQFKAINDSQGHGGGDAVLKEFARRLRTCLRATDTVARLAGDEFVILLEGIDGVLELGRLADKVVACIRAPFQLAATRLAVTTSVGVATFRGAEQTASQLLALADGALYQAKKQGRDRFVVA